MSRSYSYSIDDDAFLPPPSSSSSSSLTQSTERLADRSGVQLRLSNQQSLDHRSTRLSSTDGGSYNRRGSLPPTRIGTLKPEDHQNVDALRLVKVDSNPLSQQAVETMNALDKQKQAQKEIRSFQDESAGFDWEKNLGNWKDRRKSKPSYQLKTLGLSDDNDDEMSATGGGAKKSKTFKELMEEKEKRSNGNGTYMYENEEKPSLENRNRIHPDEKSSYTTTSETRVKTTLLDDPLTKPSTTTTTSYDSVINSTGGKTKSPASDFYFASTLTDPHSDLSSYRSKESRYTSSPSTAAAAAAAKESISRQQPEEIKVELQVQTTSSIPETKDFLRSTDTDRDSERKPWHSTTTTTTTTTTTRQKSETNPTKTTNAYQGVTLRQKPQGTTTPQARPYSYAYTPSTERLDSGYTKPEIAPKAMNTRSQMATNLSEMRTSRISDRIMDPLQSESLSKDRKTRSNWELNLGHTDRVEYKPEQRSGLGLGTTSSASNSSAKFKQALSLFQSKEAEVTSPSVNKVTAPMQRPVGKLSRPPPPVEESKPIRSSGYSSYEVRRGSAMEKGYKPTTDEVRRGSAIEKGYKPTTDRYSYQSGFGASESRNKDLSHGDRYGKQDWRTSSIETSSSRGSSGIGLRTNGNEDEKVSSSVGKTALHKYENQETGEHSNVRLELTTDLNQTYPAITSRRVKEDEVNDWSVDAWKEKREKKIPDKNDTTELKRETESSHVVLKLESPSVSTSGNKTSPSETTHSFTNRYSSTRSSDDQKPETKLKYGEEEKYRTGSKIDDDATPVWQMDQRRGSSHKAETKDVNEPKDLYAYKYKSKHLDESPSYGTRGKLYGDRETETNRFENTTTKPEFKISKHTSDDYNETHKDSKTETDLRRSKYSDYQSKFTSPELKEKPISSVELHLHYTPEKQQQQQQSSSSSISDIFSKRSAAAIRGKSTTKDDEVSDVLPHQTTIRSSTTAKETDRYRGVNSSEDTVYKKEQSSDADKLEKRSPESTVSGGVDDSIKSSHDNEPWKRKDVDVTSTTRTSREPYVAGESARRHYGLERFKNTEKDSSEKIQFRPEEPQEQGIRSDKQYAVHHVDLNQKSPMEVNFSITEVEDKRKRDADAAAAEEKIHNQKPAFEMNFSIPELDSKPKSVETKKTGNGNYEIVIQEENRYSSNTNQPGTTHKRFEEPTLVEISKSDKTVHPTTSSEVEEYFYPPEIKGHPPDGRHIFDDEKKNKEDDWKTSKRPRYALDVATGVLDPDTKSTKTKSFQTIELEPTKTDHNLHETMIVDFHVTTETDGANFSRRKEEKMEAKETVEDDIERRSESIPSAKGSIASDILVELPTKDERRPSSPEGQRSLSEGQRSLSPVRNTDIGMLIDLDGEDDDDDTQKGSDHRSPMILQEIRNPASEGRVDVNFNIPAEPKTLPPPPTPLSGLSLLEEFASPYDSKTTVETKILPIPNKKDDTKHVTERGPSERQPVTPPSDDGVSAKTDRLGDETKEILPPKKKPPEPPKTKPKPNIPKTTPVTSPETDELKFPPSTQLLDISANRDKCRLSRVGAMGSRRRPKSAYILQQDTENQLDGLSVNMNGLQTKDDSYRIENAVNATRYDATSRSTTGGNDLDPIRRPGEQLTSEKLRNKGVRPVSYMGELNSSLRKKWNDNDVNDDDHKDVHPVEEEKFGYKTAQSSSSRVKGQEEETERTTTMTTQPKIPGLMNELNFSLKTKFKNSPEKEFESEFDAFRPEVDVKKKQLSPSAAVAAAEDLMKQAVDDDDDDEDADGPPPLPNAPPPLPNWDSFPSDNTASAPPGGPPPLPPPLIDFDLPGEEFGKIELRSETSERHTTAGRNWWEGDDGKGFSSSNQDRNDFSFA